MKHLTISYDGRVLFDADVAEFTWSEGETEISVRGRTTAKPSLADALRNNAALRAPVTVNNPGPNPAAPAP